MNGTSALSGAGGGAAFRRALGELSAGRGALVEVTGDPGTGKTALLGGLARLAGARGAVVLRARAHAAEAKPYQVFREACAEAAPVPWDTAGERGHARALLQHCGPDGLVLLLDDFHHADPASLRLAEHLVGAMPCGPLLVALAHRPRQTPPALLAALDDGVQAGHVVRVETAPLDAAAVAALLPAEPADRAERLRAMSGGNPRVLRILAVLGIDPELWPARADTAAGALLRAAAPLLAEVDGLTPDTAAVLAAAAVLGEPFRLGDVAQVSGLGVDGATRALAQLSEADLVRPGRAGGGLVFRHPVLEYLVRHRMNPGPRLDAHRRALALLTRRAAPAAARAVHAEHVLTGAGPGEVPAGALTALTDGATEVFAEAPATAARWLRVALGAAPRDPADTGARVRSALDCCRALIAAGRPAEARDLGHEVLRSRDPMPEALRAEALVVCVGIERLLGRYAEADAMARTVVDLLPRPLTGPLPTQTGDLLFEYGLLHAFRGDAAEVRGLVREAAGADLGPDPDRRTALRVLAVFCDSYAGEFVRTAPELAECARIVDSRPDTVAGRAPEVLALLGCAELYLERFTEAHRHLSRGLVVASGGAHKHLAVNQLLGLSVLDQWAGRLDRSQRHASEAERLAEEIGAPDAAGLALAMRASTMLWTTPRRRTAEILALADEGLRRTVPGTGWWAGSALGLLAMGRLLGGNPEDCLRTLLDEGGEDLGLLQPPSRPTLFALMATAAALCGDFAAARRSALAADGAARGLGRPAFQQAQADRALAVLALVEGDPGRAAELALGAAAAFRSLKMPVLYAWTVIGALPALVPASGPAAALVALDDAVGAARDCGALLLVEEGARARGALTASTVGTPGASGAAGGRPASALSAREREVAVLAASGLASRLIAERLVLSPRTVETHLGSAYRKLGVSSRMELARLLARSEGGGG